MGSLFGLLGTMGSALQAQQAAMDVTGNNVSNANTPGYVRQTAVLQAVPATADSDGGVTVSSIQRAFNSFTYGQVLVQTGLQGSADARNSALTEAQATIAPTGGGAVGDSINSFFSAVQTLSASPSDPSARSAVLQQATQVAQAFSTTASGLQQQQSGILTQAQGLATTLNTTLSQIASLNGQIAQANAAGQSPADLEDQRDQLVTTVAQGMGASVVTDSTGAVTLFSGNTVLVSGSNASTVSVGIDANNAMQVNVQRPGGSTIDITQNVTDGTLGGLRESRDTDIAQSLQSLDQLAYSFSNAVNAVQSSGYGLDGQTGRNLFTAPTQVQGAAASMAVDPSVAGQPNNIATASDPNDLPGGNDTAVALAQVANQSLGSMGTATSAFAAITAQIGNAAAAASTDSATRAETVTQAQNLNSSASGVSLEEESVNLTKFQQAFEAASRVLQAADSLLSDFMTTMSTN
ncbi:MAG TPA: flagellar hook-associated protein FlgK [Polyangiaceae bacterium]|nr:flagellar hook-associated protein FlgK [Polyangiaceae bacterium]